MNTKQVISIIFMFLMGFTAVTGIIMLFGGKPLSPRFPGLMLALESVVIGIASYKVWKEEQDNWDEDGED